MRFCIPTTVSINAETKEGPDGRLIYKLNGPTTETYSEFITFLDELFYNRSYYFTPSVEECMLRMVNNESDVETSYYSYYKNLSVFTVPVPVIVTKTSLIAGFKVNSSASVREDSTAAEDNFGMLEVPVYLWSLFLISLFIFVISCKVSLSTAFTLDVLGLKLMVERRGRKSLRRKSNRTYLMKRIMQQSVLAFRGSSRRARWISFLFAILYFYVITSLMCVYSTSKIVVEEPFIVRNYKELLQRERALPFFYDVVSKVSDQFQLAPSHAMKGKVWKKLSRRDASDYIFSGKEGANPREILLRVVDGMQRDNSVFIASSLISNMLKTFGCGSSPDGSSGGPEEFWRLVVSTDPHEQEDFSGWAVANQIKDKRFYSLKVTRLFQSGILPDFFEKMTDATGFASRLAGTNARHAFKARFVCSDDFKIDKDQTIQPTRLSYYKIFSFIFLIVTVASSILLLLEKALARQSSIHHDHLS